MPDDGSAEGATWPLPSFSFTVDFGNGEIAGFAEVTGLQTETQVIEYRHGDSAAFSPIKMPGLGKVGNVTLKKGVFAKDAAFFAWFDKTLGNSIERRTVIINLLDEKGSPVMIWTLANAFPAKLSGTDLKSDGNEVAIETIEIAYETLTMKNG